MKIEQTKDLKPPEEGRMEGALESFLAPPPPSKGRIVGIDCHPDTFTAAVFTGTTPHNARQLSCHDGLTLEKRMTWAGRDLTSKDLILMEAGSNSFEICRRLQALGLQAVVLESGWVGKHAKSYADNDRMAAARMVMVYLAGNAPCVWQPDEVTIQRRELLHAYTAAVTGHVAAGNALKGYLNQYTVRLGKRNGACAKDREWLLNCREWSALQREILLGYFSSLDHHGALRKRLSRLISREVCSEPLMLHCLKLLGIGMVNAFALLATIGDVRRFRHAKALCSYLGLSPGQRQSGHGKNVKVGVGKRGRGDMRALLIQGAHAVLRLGRRSNLGAWGMKLFLRKGTRQVAVTAVARKMATQVWHALMGHPAEALEEGKGYKVKLEKLAVMLGKSLRQSLGLDGSLAEVVRRLASTTPFEPKPMIP